MFSTTPIDSAQRRRPALLVALSLLAASTLHFEVLLTKFFSNKLEHHYTFAILSIALLGFGASGVFVHLRSEKFSPDREVDSKALWPYAMAYALTLPASICAFIVLPFDPACPGWYGSLALPLYFLLFALPFFLAGVCVSALLVGRRMRPTRVYFWDLLGAGAGAWVGPRVLSVLGGYGSVAAVTIVALLAAVLMRSVEKEGAKRAISWGTLGVGVMVFVVLAVPKALSSRMHFDMVSFKHAPLKSEFMSFGGASQTYWNPIARVDVSPTGQSKIEGFRYGLARKNWSVPLAGRMVLVDGSANTRQFVFNERPQRDGILGATLWAAPYVLRPETQRALVMGPGGGIDILVGKAYGAKKIDAVELNPDVYSLLVGRPEDRERAVYTRFLQSDKATQVQVFNAEARHFVRSRPHGDGYDVVLASGVDTLTAIQTAGNALTENYLYTKDAVRDYLQLLSPGGQLALTHWHLEPPNLALRMFVTYLEVLDEQGVEHPGQRICVISEGFWENAILKKDQDFTREEVERLREFATKTGFQMVYDPFITAATPILRPGDHWFRDFGAASRQTRQAMLADYPYDISPVSDNNPYFYWIRGRHGAPGPGGWLFPMSSAEWLFGLALILTLGMAALPGIALIRRRERVGPALRALPFFMASGFAFILAENGLFLLLALFVGGPLYSLSILLPSLLVGYAMGSLTVLRFASATRRGALRLVATYAVAFAALLVASKWVFPSLFGFSVELRLAFSIALVVPFGAVLGFGTPWYMEILKVRSPVQRSLAWMWGVSSAASVVGSLLFVPLCRQLGVQGTFVLAGLLYVFALGWAAARRGRRAVLHPV